MATVSSPTALENADQVNRRLPTMTSSLRALIRHGVEVQSVIDVGVLSCTLPLMELFPGVKHYLFEPVEFYFESIQENYRHMEHQLFNVALSNENSEAFLVGLSVDGGSVITHSQIVNEPITIQQDPRVLECKKIRRAKLDSEMSGIEFASPALLKIDVDGHELAILEGAIDTLPNCSVIVIEATLEKRPLPELINRFQFIVNHGFVLLDIVDMAYYDGVLWQVDLIFVRNECVAKMSQLRPFESAGFDFNRQLWQPIAETF